MTTIRNLKDPGAERREEFLLWLKLVAEALSVLAFIALVILLAALKTGQI